MAGDMPTGAGGPSRRRHARAARTTPYARPADGQQTNAAPALNAHRPSESPGSGWGGFARSLASTPLKAAAGLKGWMFGSASPESAAENGLANGDGVAGARQAHSRGSVDGRQPQGMSDNEVEEGPTADNGRGGSAQPLPALSSVHSEQARADSQMAAMVQPDRAVQMEFDSAASPSQPRRGGRQPREQQQQRQLDRPASTPGTDAERDGGAAGEDGDVTPFDNVLSVLERIKRRQSTPFSLAPGRQPAYSPVPFAGMAEGAPQRSRLVGGSLTPYAAGGPQRPGQHRPAPYTAPRPAARQHFPALQLGSGGGGLFGEAQQGTPQEAAAAEPQPRLQAGGLFAQTASTPVSALRFGRRLGGLGGTPANSRPMAGASRPLAAGSPLALAGPRSGGLGWTPMRGGALGGGGAMATAGSSSGFGSAISARGAKRSREDDGDADAPAAAAGTPLLGSGWEGAAERASAAKRLRPAERRLRAGASSLQPRGLPAPAEAADAAAPVSTNAARRILMALETMTQTPPQSAISAAAALPPPTLSLGPPVESSPEPATSQPGKAAAPAKPVSREPRQPAQPAAEAIDTEPTAAHQPQEATKPASEAPAAAAPAAAASSGGGWGAALLNANKAAASAATAAVEAEIEKAKGGSAEQASKPAVSFSFGVAPAAAPPAASAPPAQQPKTMLADSTNSFVVPSFRFGDHPPAPKAKKVAKLVRGVPANVAGSSGSGRTFRFGMPLEEESPSPSPPSSPTAQPPPQAKEAFSLANQVAAAAAQLPLPPEEDTIVAEPPAVTEPPPAAEKPADSAPAASSGGGGGWGAALLQANAAASRKATEAVEAEIKKAAGGGDLSAAAAPAFSFGAKAAGDAPAPDSAPAAPANGLFGFSATPALSPPSLPFAFGAPPTSQVNDKSAEAAVPAAKLADSEPASGPAAVSSAFGTTSAPLTFNFGSSAAGGGFAFSATSAPAAAAESAPAAQTADAAPSAAATAASSGPAPLSFSFGTTAPASTEAGGSAAPTPSMSAAPSFAFGAGTAPAVGGSGGAATTSALPASAPAFSFGGAATLAEEAPAENGGLQRQNSLGAASNMSMTSVDGGNGANSGGLAAPEAMPPQPAASSFATFGSTQGAGFAFGGQTAPSTPFGGAASSAAAAGSAAAGSAAAPGAFAFGASSAPAFGAVASAPAFGSGGLAPAFGGASAPAFSSSATSFGGGAASAPAFGGSSAPAFGTTPAPFGGFEGSAAQVPSAPAPLSFSFGSSTNATAPAFGAGGFDASAPQPAGGPQPGGFAFGTGGGAAGGSTSLPAFSTTALGASQPGGPPQAAAATFGAPQTGSMTLGAAPGDAGGAAARRKVKLRRPGRR